MEALAGAFHAEQEKLGVQRESLNRSKANLAAKRAKVLQSKKSVEKAAKTLARAEANFARKLDDLNSIIKVNENICPRSFDLFQISHVPRICSTSFNMKKE